MYCLSKSQFWFHWLSPLLCVFSGSFISNITFTIFFLMLILGSQCSVFSFITPKFKWLPWGLLEQAVFCDYCLICSHQCCSTVFPFLLFQGILNSTFEFLKNYIKEFMEHDASFANICVVLKFFIIDFWISVSISNLLWFQYS